MPIVRRPLGQSPFSRKGRSVRSGFSLTGLAAILGFLGAILAGGFWFLKPMLFSQQQDTTYMVDRVTSGVFTHDVVERGEIESSSNVEVRSQVQSRTSGAGGGTAIIEIVPEGTMVQEGEFIVKLDDSALRDELTQQQSVVNASDSLVIQSLANLATAKIAKEEYVQGTFKQDEETLQSAAFVAEENLRRAQEYARHSERLAARGYVTQVQLEADQIRRQEGRSRPGAGQYQADGAPQLHQEKDGRAARREYQDCRGQAQGGRKDEHASTRPSSSSSNRKSKNASSRRRPRARWCTPTRAAAVAAMTSSFKREPSSASGR